MKISFRLQTCGRMTLSTNIECSYKPLVKEKIPCRFLLLITKYKFLMVKYE